MMKLRWKLVSFPSDELRSFVLTLIATLIGVFIAISLTNSGLRKKEKEDTLKLLNTSKLIVINTRTYSVELSNRIRALEQDTINSDSTRISNVKKNNPIPFPHLLETVITNEILSKNISEYSHNEIYTELINLKKLADYKTAALYEQSLSDLIYLLDLEIQFQKGELEIEEIGKKMKLKHNEF
ncbi:hypothetical protein [Altibacter lentus]|uniref:hypothetical protein n=1 Tax=Altibacter lentus TaxID=1223410 RepID=UPI000689A482|nr:hypothetical protein [Altibacter lentus]